VIPHAGDEGLRLGPVEGTTGERPAGVAVPEGLCRPAEYPRGVNLRYAVEEVREHGSDGEWWRKRFLTHVAGRYFERFPPAGRSRVVDREWDTLLLLDACRYDLFEEALRDHPLPGELSMRRSMESGTPGYLAENFAGGTFHDVVYVTANPYVHTELPPGTFHEVVPVWRDGWDEELATVTPETVAGAAREAHDEHPDKRLVVHFNQPHTPFIGEARIEGRGMANLRARAARANSTARRSGGPTAATWSGRSRSSSRSSTSSRGSRPSPPTTATRSASGRGRSPSGCTGTRWGCSFPR